MIKPLIVAAVLRVGILLPAFGEEIVESDLIGTWDVTSIARVVYFEDELNINTELDSATIPLSLGSDGFAKTAESNFLWSLDDNRLLLVGLGGGATWVLVPLEERTFLVLLNTKDLSVFTELSKAALSTFPATVLLLTMTPRSEADEGADAPIDETQGNTDTGSFIDPDIIAAIRGAELAASETQPVARSEFSAGEDALSFARESNPGEGDLAAESNDGGLAFATGTPVTDVMGTEGYQAEIVYGEERAQAGTEVGSTLDEIGLEDLQRQRRILYRPEFDLPDDILSELAEGLPEIVVPVRIVILPTGLVMNVQILRSSGVTRLDALITEDLRKWKFQPENVERNQTLRFPYVISATSG